MYTKEESVSIQETRKTLNNYIGKTKDKISKSNQIDPANLKELGVLMSLYEKSHKALTNLSQRKTDKLVREINRLNEIMSAIEQIKIPELQKQIVDINSLLEKSEDSLKNLEQLKSYQSELSSILSEINQVNPELNSKLSKLTNANHELKSMLDKLNQVNPKLKSILDKLTQANPKLKSILDKLTQANSELNSKINLEPITGQQKQIEEIITLLKNYQDSLENLQQLKADQSKLSSILNKLKPVKPKLNSLLNKLTKVNPKLKSILDKLTQANSELNSKIDLGQIAWQQKQIEEIISLLKNSEDSLKNLEQLKADQSELSSILNKLTKANPKLNSTLDKLTKVNSELNSKIDLGQIAWQQKQIEEIITLLKKPENSLTNLVQLKAYQSELCINQLYELNSAIELVNIAINTLIDYPKTLIFVRKLRYSAECTIDGLAFPYYSKINNPWRRFWRSTKIPTKIILGLGLGILLNIGLSAYTQHLMKTSPSICNFFSSILSSAKTADCPQEKSQVQLPTLSPTPSPTSSPTSSLTPLPTLSPTPLAIASPNSSPNSSSTPSTEKLQDQSYGTFSGFFVWVWICGTTGSVVSIFWRVLDDHDKDSKYSDNLIPLFIGAFKPLVGGVSGLVVFFALESHLFPLELASLNNVYQELFAFGVIGFVSGFSERIIKDMIDKTENSLTSGKIQQSLTPTTIEITPSEVQLGYREQCQFEITPKQFFQYNIVPNNLGEISLCPGLKSIIYTAPTEDEAKGVPEVRIIVRSEDYQSMDVATVKLIPPPGSNPPATPDVSTSHEDP